MLASVGSARADAIKTNLAVWLDGGDYNAVVFRVRNGNRLEELAATEATYNGTLAKAVGSGPGPAWSGTGTSATHTGLSSVSLAI